MPAVAEPASAVAPSVPLPATPSQAEPASPETTGYDAETGQVLDAAKYARWRREQLTVKEQPAMTVYEAFLTARQSLQEWVDAEASKPLVLAGDIDSIKQNPAVIALVQTYKGYGPTMVEKLSKHLDFIVLNNPRIEGAGFDTDTNIVTILSKSGKIEKLPRLPKFEVGHRILDRVAKKFTLLIAHKSIYPALSSSPNVSIGDMV